MLSFSLSLQTFVKTHHKVGVLSVKQGQCSEEEIFGNLHEPDPFDDFLNVLGTYTDININLLLYARFLNE